VNRNHTPAGDDTDGALTCPSSHGAPGNLLIGIVAGDGSVMAVRPPLPVDETFVDQARHASERPPEARFRFAGPCETNSCRQWTGSRCAVGDIAAATHRGPQPLQPCAIRPTCRWWAQNGAAACRGCTLVVHTPPDEHQHHRADH
jgi:hypothetical protein